MPVYGTCRLWMMYHVEWEKKQNGLPQNWRMKLRVPTVLVRSDGLGHERAAIAYFLCFYPMATGYGAGNGGEPSTRKAKFAKGDIFKSSASASSWPLTLLGIWDERRGYWYSSTKGIAHLYLAVHRPVWYDARTVRGDCRSAPAGLIRRCDSRRGQVAPDMSDTGPVRHLHQAHGCIHQPCFFMRSIGRCRRAAASKARARTACKATKGSQASPRMLASRSGDLQMQRPALFSCLNSPWARSASTRRSTIPRNRRPPVGPAPRQALSRLHTQCGTSGVAHAPCEQPMGRNWCRATRARQAEAPSTQRRTKNNRIRIGELRCSSISH